MACGGWACGSRLLWWYAIPDDKGGGGCEGVQVLTSGSYRQLSEFGLRKSAARGGGMSWKRMDELSEGGRRRREAAR